jgi:NADH-quinone oxidoreductase subunit N
MISFNLIPLLPELFLILTGMGLLIVGVIRGNDATPVVCWAAVCALTIALILLLGLDWERDIVLNGMFKFDRFAGFMKLMILLGLITSTALSVKFLEQEGINRFEYPVLIMFAGIGMMLMVSANNFLSLYMGLELQSLSLYVLAAFHRNSLKSSEAGIKYFVLGALSSGMLLFGISMIYGFTGSLDFGAVQTTLHTIKEVPPGVTVGMVFILAGIAFKISAAPFHMWTPDVYQGAPTGVTALFAIVPKIAAMGLLIRLLFEPFASIADQWEQIIYFLSAASMIVGAFAALRQENIKRLMAYSSIGNMGYALVGLVAGSEAGVSAVILYMLLYMVMTAGVFTIILSLRRDGAAYEKISDLKGMSRHNPVLAYAMAILMFSMSGIPPMAGFFGKLLVFQAAVAAEHYTLAVLGVLSSVVAAYYYLRIIKVMFFEEGGDAFESNMPFVRRTILFISIFFVIAFVIKPSLILFSTQGAASVLFSG